MKFIYRSKLFKQLTGVIGFLVLLAIGIPSAFTILYITPTLVEDRYHQVMRDDVEFLANRLDWHLAKSIRDVKFLTSQISVIEEVHLIDAGKKIDLFVKSSAMFTGGVVTDNEGILQIFYSSPQGVIEMKQKHDLSYREYIKQPITNNKSFISNVIITETNPNPVIFISNSIVENGITTGVLAMTINLWNENNIFFTLFNFFTENKQGSIYVIDDQGTIIYHWNKEQVGNKLNNAILDNILGKKDGMITEITVEDTRKAVAYSKLQANNWVVVYEIDHNNIYALNKLGRITSLGTMALVLILGLIASVIFVKIIIRPLGEIIIATEQVAAGDFNIEIDKKGHQDFQPLIKNFNSMIKNLRFQYEELEKLSLHDYLTGLANRRYFQQQLERELERANRLGHITTLMIIDIDNFKYINDVYGHLVGDKAIMAVAAILKESMRSNDMPVRYGGDEFIVLLPETTIQQCEVVAKKISEAVRQINIHTRKGNINFTISIGLVSTEHYPKFTFFNDKAIHNFIRKADSALYQAKHMGKDRIESYKEDQL